MPESEQSLTYGQKMVGLQFNHAEGETHDKVHRIKAAAAVLLDELREQQVAGGNEQQSRFYDQAIDDVVTAQMLGVKAATWKA